jgi:hypothetical protein
LALACQAFQKPVASEAILGDDSRGRYDIGEMVMLKEFVIPFSDLRKVSVECGHCQALITVDLKGQHNVTSCPACSKEFDPSVKDSLDQLHVLYLHMENAKHKFSFQCASHTDLAHYPGGRTQYGARPQQSPRIHRLREVWADAGGGAQRTGAARIVHSDDDRGRFSKVIIFRKRYGPG